jgi:Secretion system C-terminal sorting domain
MDEGGNVYASGFIQNSDRKIYVAQWNGSSWVELGTGIYALNANSWIFSVRIDAMGNVYTAGAFTDPYHSDSPYGNCYVAKYDVAKAHVKPVTTGHSEVVVFPNPSGDMLNISVPTELVGVGYTISNTNGELVASSKIENTITSLTLSAQAPGLYVLHIRDSINSTFKFIKQ